MKKALKNVLGGIVLLTLTLVLVACGESSEEENGVVEGAGKVAFVTGTGGLGDGGFNDLGYAGVEMLMEEGVQVDVAEPTSISDIEGIIENFAYSGEYDIIVSMGGDSVDPINNVAAEYPDQPMVIVDGLGGNVNPNVTGLLLSQSDATFILGAYAALMFEEGVLENARGNDTIGVVGGMDNPTIRSAVSGYTAGAKYINPEITVLDTYVGSWNDPGAGSELAKTIISQGADIVFAAAGASGLGALEATASEGYYGLGYDGNQNVLYPDSILASGYRDTAQAIYDLSKSAINGEFEGGDLELGIQDSQSFVQLTTEESNIETPQHILDTIEDIKVTLHESSVSVPDEQDQIDAFLEEFGTFGE